MSLEVTLVGGDFLKCRAEILLVGLRCWRGHTTSTSVSPRSSAFRIDGKCCLETAKPVCSARVPDPHPDEPSGLASRECRSPEPQRRERSILNGLSAAQKSPRLGAGGFVQLAKKILSADRYTGLQIRWTNNRQRRLRHDQFDPEGIPAPEIRRRVRLAQCVHAGLFRSGGCFGETRQLKYDPCPLVHFGQTERDLLSFGLHQDLGAGTHSALVAGDLEVLAIAAQDDWLLGSSTAASTATARGSRRRRRSPPRRTSGRSGTSGWTISTDRREKSEPSGPSFDIDCAWKFSSTVRQIQAADITRAHGGVPGRLDLAGAVSDDAVVLAVVEHDVGIADARHRTVQVVDGQGPVAHATTVVVIESGIDFRKIYRLGIDEFRTADRASGTDPRAREQQPGKRSGFSPIVVLEIHERCVHHIIAVIVVFVTADREIRYSPLREAAAIGNFLGRRRIADIVGLAHDQRINQPCFKP